MGKGKKLSSRRRPYRQPDWKDIQFTSRRNLGGGTLYKHVDSRYERGYYLYCTPGELTLARLLSAQGIEFTPDVTMPIPPKGGSKKSRAYVPDFIFNGAEYVWTEDDGTEFVIHGLECKGANRKSEKAKALYGKRGIHVLVLFEAEIDLYAQRGWLPLRLRS